MIPEDECSVCRLFRDMLENALKSRGIWRILPSGNECSINLASEGFRKFWGEWWGNEDIPQLDIDILTILDEKASDNLGAPCLLGIEVKYFKKGDKRNFYEGLDQALAYLSIGLDKAALLHIFHPEYPEERIRIRAKTMERLVKYLKLPIAYVACKLLNNGKFRMYTEYYTPSNVTVQEVFHFLKQAQMNPLYSHPIHKGEMVKIRQTLTACLQIPTIPPN